jgi:predicted nucleic acid-binding protein
MTDIMVDSNILIDIFNEDQHWFSWSSKIIEQYAEQSQFVINPIIYAEISVAFKKIEELEDALPAQYFNRESIPMEAAFLVGKVYSQYRKSGGKRNSSLPDFFIGAHAAVRGMRLITRDISRYKTYFPDLQLISPE